jgi:hypothetical protein
MVLNGVHIGLVAFQKRFKNNNLSIELVVIEVIAKLRI